MSEQPSADSAADPDVPQQDSEDTFDRLVDEGGQRLGRSWPGLISTGVLGGVLITLMTHLQHATESDGVRLVPAIAMGFLLGAGKINHAIVASLLCFAALQAGAPFGYADWLGMFAFAVLGNMIGGLGLVTMLRLLQVPNKVLAERRTGHRPA